MLWLPHPSTQSGCYFLFTGSTLLQVHQFNNGSFTFNDNIIQDGSVYHCTKYDPIFILISHLAVKTPHFLTIDNILSSTQYPHLDNLQALKGISELLACVCDTNSVDNETYYRVNQEKIINWLKRKVEHMLLHFSVLEMSMITDNNSKILLILDLLSDNLSIEMHKSLVDSYA
jgi:ribonuclease H2 subunit B